MKSGSWGKSTGLLSITDVIPKYYPAKQEESWAGVLMEKPYGTIY